jgi:hypothetical protein
MNANEICPKASTRLNRIKKISRVLKVLFLLYFVCAGYFFPFVYRVPEGFWFVVCGTYATFSDSPMGAKLIVVLAVGVFFAAVITGYQLLNLYEKGIIFSARNVQLLGRIGYLALGYGLLTAWGPALISAWYAWINSSVSLLNPVLWGMTAFLSSPWIIGGLFVVVISRIMDEGRKIQEEQELTV